MNPYRVSTPPVLPPILVARHPWWWRLGHPAFFPILVLLPGLLISGACATLTPAQKADIAKDQIELGVCQAEAHFEKDPDAAAPNAKAWATFDACMRRMGFYDGGADAR